MGFTEEWPQVRRDGDTDVPALSALVDVLVVGHRGLLCKTCAIVAHIGLVGTAGKPRFFNGLKKLAGQSR